MTYNTAGNKIYKSIQNCDCGLTGGCKKCNPPPSFIGSITDEEAEEMRKKLKDWKRRFNEDLERRYKILFPPNPPKINERSSKNQLTEEEAEEDLRRCLLRN